MYVDCFIQLEVIRGNEKIPLESLWNIALLIVKIVNRNSQGKRGFIFLNQTKQNGIIDFLFDVIPWYIYVGSTILCN